MKKLLCLLFLLSFSFLSLVAQPRFGEAELFNEQWKFKLATANDKDNPLTVTDFSRWRNVTLPHDWSVEGAYSRSNASATGFLPGGMGWYEKSFTVPTEQQGKKIYLYFEGVYNRSKVYLNGELVGGRPNGYLPFLCDLTPYLKFGEENRILVQVDHTLYNDSRWYTGSGIYRDVFLVYANPVHVGLWGTFCNVESSSKKRAVFNVTTALCNESDKTAKAKVSLALINCQTGKKVGQAEKTISILAGDSVDCVQQIKLNNPEIWSIENLNLYKVVSTVMVDGKQTEQSEVITGVRRIRFDANEGFFLNDVNMKLKGVCIHHDAGCLGAAVPKTVWERRLKNLKLLGCNAIRMSHNPQATDVYDLCDQLGLLVMDEAFDEWEYPKRKWIEGWNKGKPGYDGSADFFYEWCEADLRDMVLRDRNHPSIILWSIGNEVDYPNDPYSHPILDKGTINQPVYGGYNKKAPEAERLSAISKRLAETVRKYDTSRPVTAALAGVIMSNQTDYPANIDVCGYNYTEDRYELDHNTYPERIIYGSENGHGLDAWKAVTNNDYIAGQFLWTGIDYLGESRDAFSRGSTAGLLNFAGYIKPNGYFRRALWADEPVAYLGTYPAQMRGFRSLRVPRLSTNAYPYWNYEDGALVRVVSYSNAPQTRLLLNGDVVGEAKPLDTNTHITYWDIPYKAGKLTLEGLDESGKVICTHSVATSGRPYAIQAVADATELQAGRGVSQIEITIVDENNNPVFLSDDYVTCMVQGAARLLGMEGGDNNDMESYKDFRQRVVNGKLIAYVQAQAEAGEAVVTFSATWLQKAEVKLIVK